MFVMKNINKTFPGHFKPVLKNIHLHLKAQDFCVVVGSNGSGKSTLMKMIAGEYAIDSGQILIHGQNLNHRNRQHTLAFVTQDIHQGTIPEMTLLENMFLSLKRNKKNYFGLYHRQASRIVEKLQVLGLGLEHYLHTPLSHLSGGQRQMVATIMAISSAPKLLLLDEHTSALDPAAQHMVMNYTAQSIHEYGLTSLMITHNLNDAINYGNRLIMLHQGQIVLDLSEEEKSQLTPNQLLNLFHTYEDRTLMEQP